jgi:hypothetical protein
MPNEYSQRLLRTRRTRSRNAQRDLADWRRLTRPLILDDFVDRTRDLPWSRELIDLLLDELLVSDEFEDLISRVVPPAPVNIRSFSLSPWSCDVAGFSRTSFRILAELGVSPSSGQGAPACVPSTESVDAADAHGAFTGHPAPALHACTFQKEER